MFKIPLSFLPKSIKSLIKPINYYSNQNMAEVIEDKDEN